MLIGHTKRSGASIQSRISPNSERWTSGSRFFRRFLKIVSEAAHGRDIDTRRFEPVSYTHLDAYKRQLKEADEALLALKGLKGGRIAIAVASTAEYFAPGLLAQFRKTHADVRIRLLIDNRDTVFRLLASNEVDLAIMGRPPPALDATAVAFAPHPLVTVSYTHLRPR